MGFQLAWSCPASSLHGSGWPALWTTGSSLPAQVFGFLQPRVKEFLLVSREAC